MFHPFSTMIMGGVGYHPISSLTWRVSTADSRIQQWRLCHGSWCRFQRRVDSGGLHRRWNFSVVKKTGPQKKSWGKKTPKTYLRTVFETKLGNFFFLKFMPQNHENELWIIRCVSSAIFKIKIIKVLWGSLDPQNWRHFEDPNFAVQVQTLPLEGPRSSGFHFFLKRTSSSTNSTSFHHGMNKKMRSFLKQLLPTAT